MSDRVKPLDKEREANVFATALLMPEEFVRRDWPVFHAKHGDDAIQQMARHYQVEEWRMGVRLVELKLVRA